MKRILKMSFQEKADQGFRVMKGKGNQATSQRVRVKVAAYCRVSTLQESQESSIEGQYLHYEQLIKSDSDWEFAGIYLEVGVTGTKAEVRSEYFRTDSGWPGDVFYCRGIESEWGSHQIWRCLAAVYDSKYCV